MTERIGLGSFGLVSANLQFGSLLHLCDLSRYDHSLGEPVCLTRTTPVSKLHRRCRQTGGELTDHTAN